MSPKEASRRRLLSWTLLTVMLGFVLIWHAFQPDDYQLWFVPTLLCVELAQWFYQEFIAT